MCPKCGGSRREYKDGLRPRPPFRYDPYQLHFHLESSICLSSCWSAVSGYRFRKSRRAELSQHFLRSRALAASLVRQAALSPQDLVVEIGPGRGLLTAELGRVCGAVRAVEVDRELCDDLRRRFRDDAHVDIVCADFLRYTLPRGRPYKVFGNIPYNRTAAIVRRVTGAPSPPDDVYLVMQREAAQRFAGWPFGAETLPSLLLKPVWHVEIARELRRKDFDPPPRVESVMIWLARRRRPLVEEVDLGAYRSFVEGCFGRRGSTVARCVRNYITHAQIHRLAKMLRFDPKAPPSALSFEQWLGLFRFHRWNGRRA